MRISMTSVGRVRGGQRPDGARNATTEAPPRVVCVALEDALRSELQPHATFWAHIDGIDHVELENADALVVDIRAVATDDEPVLTRLAARLPVLLVANTVDEPRASTFAERVGAASLVLLPIDPAELRRRLALLAEVRRLRRALSVTEAALEHSVTGLVITDPLNDHGIVYASPTFERMTGFDAEEVLGRNCRFLQGPASSGAELAKLRHAVQEWSTARVVVENYRKDGTPFWNEVTVFPVRDDGGRFLYYGGLQHDVTALVEARAELARMQRELVERHSFTMAILDGLQVAIATTDQQGVVTFVNPAACNVLGTTPGECLGRSAEDVLQLPASAREWMRSRSPGATRIEYVLQPRIGSPREIGASIRCAESSPEGLGHFFVFRDLAETRQAERIERLAAVSTMAAGFAHEVRNPLASVRMFGEILLAELDPKGEHHDIVGRMLTQVNRIERLVRTSLQMARPEKPKLGSHWPSVLVNGALEALVPRVRRLTGELAVEVAENLPRVSCEDAQVVQVLVILANNALDATQSPERVRLVVTQQSERNDLDPAGRAVVRFAVQDDGPGVPDHLRAAIFHPFFTTKPQGTGLGLSIAQQIAHENGGRIELNPRPQGGSVFTLVLPAAQV